MRPDRTEPAALLGESDGLCVGVGLGRLMPAFRTAGPGDAGESTTIVTAAPAAGSAGVLLVLLVPGPLNVS